VFLDVPSAKFEATETEALHNGLTKPNFSFSGKRFVNSYIDFVKSIEHFQTSNFSNENKYIFNYCLIV
jgi:hypothetical protein